MTARIHIAAALLLNAEGKTLLVRKRGTGAFMQPGGKIEAGERPEDALGRELKEELDIDADIAQARFLGRFSAPAANEPGFEVCCELYEILVDAAVVPAAEIEEAVWVDADSATARELAPLTRDHVLPLYRQRLAERPGLDTVE
jgi:8-oxo-dGTP pyrophosphatase MutT (NUDIX family)